MNSEEYIEKRLRDQIDWYDRKSLANQKVFKWLSITEIVAAALIPFLSGLLISIPKFRLIGTIIVGSLGMTVAVIAGILSLGRHKEHRIEYRTICQSLKRESFLFQTGVKPYDGDDAFGVLVERVETLVSKETINWAEYMMKPEQEKKGSKP